jgi:NAD(P)-dependent dehydrogenase (short-subunit alcohol dehydrogenase family)
MARVFVTGSTDGIGRETARQLLAAGHDVVAHAKVAERADQVRAVLPDLAEVVVGDLASLEQTRNLAAAATAAGPFDAVIHNAGVGGGESEKVLTADGIERTFQVNTVAPYVLTALMPRPSRLVYVASGLQAQGHVEPDELEWPWDGMQAYSDSKVCDVALALAVARLWPDVFCNAVDPGWIRTKVWLATSDDDEARVSGRYLKRFAVLEPNLEATDLLIQEGMIARLAELTGVELPC